MDTVLGNKGPMKVTVRDLAIIKGIATVIGMITDTAVCRVALQLMTKNGSIRTVLRVLSRYKEMDRQTQRK